MEVNDCPMILLHVKFVCGDYDLIAYSVYLQSEHTTAKVMSLIAAHS